MQFRYLGHGGASRNRTGGPDSPPGSSCGPTHREPRRRAGSASGHRRYGGTASPGPACGWKAKPCSDEANPCPKGCDRKLKAYTEPSLLVCDELGYLALDQQTSNLFYQVISTRHSHKRSTVITTNTPFSDWGNILFNTTIATAIADRLVENSEIFLLGGDSLRKANKNPDPLLPSKLLPDQAPRCDDNPVEESTG